MLFSKASLQVVALASDDRRDLALHRVHLSRDGSTVATNGRAMLAVGPPDPERAGHFPDVEASKASPPAAGVGVLPETVTRVLRTFPSEKRPSLQYAQMTRCDEKDVELMTTDGRERRKIANVPMRGRFPSWRRHLADARKAADQARMCINARDMIKMLQTILKTCPDPGNHNPVFLHMGGPTGAVFVEAHNPATGQRVVGRISPLDTGGAWIGSDAWEDGVTGVGAKPRKVGEK